MTQSARQVPDQRPRQRDQFLGDAGGVHQVCGQHEKRDRQQQERVVRLEHLVEQQERRQAIVDEEHRHASQAERERDRDAKDDQYRENTEQDRRDFTGPHCGRPRRA